jgi:hypothetical protein
VARWARRGGGALTSAGWAGEGVGPRRKRKNGLRWRFLGRMERETAGWTRAGLLLLLSFFISFAFLFLIQTKLNPFEFKFEIEFKPNSNK